MYDVQTYANYIHWFWQAKLKTWTCESEINSETAKLIKIYELWLWIKQRSSSRLSMQFREQDICTSM